MVKSIRFKEYKQLSGQTLSQVSKVGDVLRRFDRTPFPMAQTDVVCPHFMLLAWANGCPYNCAWCYLRGTFRFYGQKPNGRVPIVLKKREVIAASLQPFVDNKSLPGEIINTGELSDSLMDEGANPFSEWIMKYVDGTQHKVLFLTKSTNIQNFVKNEWQKNAILSWSINAEAVAARWENYAPTPEQRLQAAKTVADLGYEVRFRIDPMVPVLDWQKHYADLIGRIFELFKPSRVTLGCLRGLVSTVAKAKDKSWIVYLTESSNWGRKPPFAERLRMYQFVIERLRHHGLQEYGVCKDTLQIWKALGLNPKEIKCNCVR